MARADRQVRRALQRQLKTMHRQSGGSKLSVKHFKPHAKKLLEKWKKRDES